MGLETANFISELDQANPTGSDIKGLGDNHLRMIKGALRQQFPNFTPVAVNATCAELNYLVGLTSSAQTQLDTKAPKSSPALTGTPTAPTAAPATNTTQIATTEFVGVALTDFAPLASPALTGTPTAPTAVVGASTAQIATTAFVTATSFSAALPGQAGNAGKFVSTDGTNAFWVSGLETIAYADRATLRAATPGNGDGKIIDGLGYFIFFSGSDEPDDDESCFATASGRWLLECPHWDVVDRWQLPDDDERDARMLGIESRTLSGTAVCAITSVGSIASTAFTGTVAGAATGDRVTATPPGALGATDADSARLAYHAWVSASNTVTVRLTNASAASATTNAAIQAAWPITVIKT